MGFFSNEEFVRYKKCTQPVYQTPASVQQMLDISAIHENGIFEIERNNGSGNRKRKFDRVYSFSDLNYADQDRQRKDGICFQLRKFLNSMDTDFKITVQCEPRDVNNFRRSLLQDEEKSAYPELARYNNEMIQSSLSRGQENVRKQRYLTVSTRCKSIELSLFPSVEEQLGTVVAAEAGTKYIQPTDFSLHQDALTEILRSGGGKRNSRRRIYAKYTAGYDADNMINFLKNEYGQTGKGFSVDGNPVSVWFNEQGMRAAYGMQAMENPVLSLGWKDIEKYIRSMVENGSYISASEAARVAEGERARVADQIYFFMRDGINESYPEIGLEWLGTYPENAKKLTELLSDHTGREQLQSILKAADLQLKSGEKVLQWKYVKRPEYLLSEIRDLDQEPLKFPLVDILNVKQEDFITQDEIDYALCEGSDFSGGKYRIYDYFIEGHDKKDTIEFLKKEYGTGGRSSALPGNDNSQADHDARGIRLEKGSYGNPYAKVLLKWNIVEKRLRELIAADKYLSVKEKEKYQKYKEEQVSVVPAVTIETPESDESDTLMSDKANTSNFHITDNALGVGTPKEKFGKNIEAIKLLKQIETEHRYATPQEQEILSQYVGWGGLSDAFDERKSNWSTEYQVLRELLSSEEYSMARESTLNSHYTNPVIIRQMYHSLRRMGFVKGNVLEPSMGIGNFFGMLPDSMRESNLYGVELDDISGRIAKQLYPQADIQINGFEKTDYPNDFFDLAIGNVPFGQYKVFDRAYDKHNFFDP